MDKKSVREAKVARKIEQRIKLKKRKLGNDVENLFQSPAHDQIRGSEDEPQAKFLKRDEPNKVEREMKMEKLRKKKRKKEKESKGDEPNNVEREKKMDKLRKKKKKKTEKESKGDEPNNVERENKMDKLRKKKKRKTEKESKGNAGKSSEDDNNFAKPKWDEPNKVEREKKTDKLRKKKRKKDKESKGIGEGVSSCATDSCQTDTQNGSNTTAPEEADIGINSKSPGRSKKAAKVKKKDRLSSKKSNKFKGKTDTVDPDEVYYISSEDEDSSKGMKKWVMEHHQSRPGLEILQQRIDEFITAHEEQEEQVRKERSAQAAEGGWTVVVHHKGRKKTTDSESGITVGSVAQAAVVDKMSKKKSKEVGIDFYRFQRREAQRNEIMMLQSKFEQDRKRIQQLRAARKFRPY